MRKKKTRRRIFDVGRVLVLSDPPATLCASRWLVGSSNSRMSGLANNRRQMATRRRSPPDSTATSANGLKNSARHVMECYAAQTTSVQDALDDEASTINQSGLMDSARHVIECHAAQETTAQKCLMTWPALSIRHALASPGGHRSASIASSKVQRRKLILTANVHSGSSHLTLDLVNAHRVSALGLNEQCRMNKSC
jgi:hypothetical protein